MKRTFVLTALAAASTAALAQQTSSLTVYGILDAGVSRVSGLRGGTRNDVVSGVMDGSRLGFRGNEDIGGGYRAIFTMESRLELDTGDIKNRPYSGTQFPDRLTDPALTGFTITGLPAANTKALVAGTAAALGTASLGTNLAGNFWDRQVYVGLVTPFGAVTAGRQYTPAYEVSANFDTLGTQSSLSAGQVASFPPGIDIRLSNTVAYRIQTGPITASLMAAPSERSATTGHFIGGMAMYKTEAFSVGLGYNTRENELGQKSLTSTVIGASAPLGPGTAFVDISKIQDDNPSGLSSVPALVASNAALAALPVANRNAIGAAVGGFFVNGFKQDALVTHVGYRLTTGPNVVYVAYSMLNDKRPADADVASYGVAYTYWLSKRTGLNAVATHFNNKGQLAQSAPGQAGFAGGVTEAAGVDSNSFTVGIRHAF